MEHVAVSIHYFLGSLVCFGKFSNKHERALMSADARERKSFFLSFVYRKCARSHSLSFCHFFNAVGKIHHQSLELVSMVQLSQCQQKCFAFLNLFSSMFFFCYLFSFILSSIISVWRLAGVHLFNASKTEKQVCAN